MLSLKTDSDVRALHVGNNNQLRTYAFFKKECCFEPYLVVIRDVHKRTCLSPFRMGVSMLRIEAGRYEANGTCGSHVWHYTRKYASLSFLFVVQS